MIKDDIQSEIFKSLKQGNKERVNVLRYVLSQIKYREINTQKDITDEETVSVLRQEIKKRNEAIEMFKKGSRQDLVEQNQNEIAIIREYLPPSLSDSELNKIINDILKESEVPVHTGKLIGLVIGKTKGRAEPGRIAQLVNQKLAKT